MNCILIKRLFTLESGMVFWKLYEKICNFNIIRQTLARSHFENAVGRGESDFNLPCIDVLEMQTFDWKGIILDSGERFIQQVSEK